jgi:Predicted ATPases of PP-loop superfamily
VAGDQAVENHLSYMKRLAAETGAELREPLWGRDPAQVLREEVQHMDVLIIGARHRELVCRLVTRENVEEFTALARQLGVDPLGELGEYHTLVVRYLDVRIPYRCGSVEQYGDYHIARL